MFDKFSRSPSKVAIALLILMGNGLPVTTAYAARSHPHSEDIEPVLTLTKTLSPTNMLVSTPSEITHNPTLTAEFDAYLQAHYETGRFMGAAIVVQDGKTVFVNSYGMANLEHQVRHTHSTKFRIGSITKQFTAAAILQLQDRGLVDVQAPIATYLPNYPHGERITLHHLLTHTAGIPNLTSFPDYLEWMKQPTTLEDLIARFRDLPLEFEPSKQYRYSNSGYVLLTQIIEQISGKAYADYLQTQLFTPLGLADTGYEHSLAVINGLANGYRFIGEDYQQAEYVNMDVPAGAGGLYSTLEDLIRWQQFLITTDNRPSGILSDAAITAMQTPYIPMGEDAPGLSYGYGLVMDAQGFIFHGGGINGFVTHVVSLPDEGITVAVLSNVENADPSKNAEDLLAILKGQPYQLPTNEEAVTIAPERLDHYVGTYQVLPEFQVAITVEAGQLHIQGTGQPKIPLYPASENEFFARMLEFRIVFNTAADGMVESATLLQNGQTLPAPKVD
ncbi:MAG: serine hydrolase [Cyanobacteria bacterium P01_F01_bin.86]